MRRINHQLQRGLTLLEVIVTLAILSSAVAGVASLIDSYAGNMRASVVGQQVGTFGQAMEKYVKDNYSAVSAVATSTTPALIRVSTLISAGYLQGFTVGNSYGQNICGLVLEPSPGQLNALVVTEGGTAINDVDLGHIAGVIGGAGGGLYSTNTANFRGTMGGWSVPVGNFSNANQAGLRCDGSAGAVAIAAGHPVMALWFNGGDTTAGLLYRNAVPGQPQLNQMNTPIVMSSTQTTGTACSTTGAIAQDGAGVVISCQGGTWKTQSAYWQGPVANFAALPACSASTAWQTRVVRTPTTGSGPRAYTCDGTTWKALAVDNSGNLTIDGTATINKLAGNLQVATTATEGTACSPDGRVSTSNATSGLLLTCQSGVWRMSFNRDGTVALTGRLNSTHNDWSMTTYGPGFAANAAPQSGVGSLYVNDIYLRSSGKWASQLGGGTINFAAAYYVYVGDGGQCPANSVAIGVGGFYATYTAGYLYCAPVN